MGAGKTRVISVRLEEELYKKLEEQAKERKEAVSQYVREVLYSFHYPTEEILKKLEENKSLLDYSIQMVSKRVKKAARGAGKKVKNGQK